MCSKSGGESGVVFLYDGWREDVRMVVFVSGGEKPILSEVFRLDHDEFLGE